MRGYSFENHNNLKIVSGAPATLVGHLDLEAGSYLAWGKLSLGVNVAGGYPPPPYPHATGVAFLALGDADDTAYFGVKPDAAENNATLNLMCAATIPRSRRARLYLLNLYPLPVYCHHIRLMALQVDALVEREAGEDQQEAPTDEQERLRDAIMKGKVTDGLHIAKLFDKDP